MPQDDNSAAGRRVYRLGEIVRIRTGAFSSFIGRVEGINQSRRLLKVAVEIFGRRAPVKLSFANVEKIVFTEDH
ncbi:MAG TPA: hypothetical protein VM864_10545 [Pyrinomonadaceae bacterium]|jgi:transcriptional antiterminator NusG|nr:hypothetical protein [Pyrinomonadaceae bacterium]